VCHRTVSVELFEKSLFFSIRRRKMRRFQTDNPATCQQLKVEIRKVPKQLKLNLVFAESVLFHSPIKSGEMDS